MREARGTAYPDPVRAAIVALEAGADGVTAHLREDRRHISDDDIARLAAMLRERGRPLNLEMAVTSEMLEIALKHRPHAVCLVPERREERTTEGGLDVAHGHNWIAPFVEKLTQAGSRVSLFIGVVAPLLFVFFGIVYGSTAGFAGGRIDQLMMRVADFVVALPFLLFMILFRIAFGIGPGESGVFPMLVALVLLSWPATARLVRGQVLQIRNEAYIGASRLLGARTGYLVFRHMIPNTIGSDQFDSI